MLNIIVHHFLLLQFGRHKFRENIFHSETIIFNHFYTNAQSASIPSLFFVLKKSEIYKFFLQYPPKFVVFDHEKITEKVLICPLLDMVIKFFAFVLIPL